MLWRINICHQLIVFFVLYINKTRPKFSIDCKVRICTLENIILYSKIIQIPQVWVKLCHILYVRGGHLGGHLGFWKSQVGGKWPPTEISFVGCYLAENAIKWLLPNIARFTALAAWLYRPNCSPRLVGMLLFYPGHVVLGSCLDT